MTWTLKEHIEHELTKAERRVDQRFHDNKERTDLQFADSSKRVDLALGAFQRVTELTAAGHDSTRAYLERAINDQAKRFEEARASDTMLSLQLRETQKIAVDTALVSAEKAVNTALDAAKEAVLKAEVSTEKRLSLLNELRNGVATKEQMNALEQRLSDIKERVDKSEALRTGRTNGLHDYMGYVLFAITLIGFFLMYSRK